MGNQGLLKILNECEYPAEFLVARLRGKTGTLFRNWEFLIDSSDAAASLQNSVFYVYLKKYGAPGIWRFLHNEHLWVYKRMNNTLRIQFAPYFASQECKTLVVYLRYLVNRQENRFDMPDLHSSLLHEDIQDILTSGLEFSAMLQQLELYLCSESDHFKGLHQQYEKKGITGLEVYLRDCFFAYLLSQKQPSLLKTFLHYLADYQNCLTLAKTLRWEIDRKPALISGGTIPAECLQRAYSRKDLTPVLKFLHLKAPNEDAHSLQKLETSLLSFISLKLKRWSMQRTVVGEILLYLWEQYRYTRNISMVLNTIQVEDERVRENIVV
jgi:hypothetical protein